MKRVDGFSAHPFVGFTFERFMRDMVARVAEPSTPMRWMFMPFDMYFEGVEEEHGVKVNVFQLDGLAAAADLLRGHGFTLNCSRVTNKSVHYTDELRGIVDSLFAYEIRRFGYTFGQP